MKRAIVKNSDIQANVYWRVTSDLENKLWTDETSDSEKF
jgi:hypothetical protein